MPCAVSPSQTVVDGDSNPGLCPPGHQPSKHCHRQEALGRPGPHSSFTLHHRAPLWTEQRRWQQRGHSPWQLGQLEAEGPLPVLLPTLRILTQSERHSTSDITWPDFYRNWELQQASVKEIWARVKVRPEFNLERLRKWIPDIPQEQRDTGSNSALDWQTPWRNRKCMGSGVR